MPGAATVLLDAAEHLRQAERRSLASLLGREGRLEDTFSRPSFIYTCVAHCEHHVWAGRYFALQPAKNQLTRPRCFSLV
jgi:hypothetical protein